MISQMISCNPKCDIVHDDIRTICKDIASSLKGLVSIVTGDAFSYKVITEGTTSQLRVLSRAQFKDEDVEFLVNSVQEL